jgi:hypothetical protein
VLRQCLGLPQDLHQGENISETFSNKSSHAPAFPVLSTEYGAVPQTLPFVLSQHDGSPTFAMGYAKIQIFRGF